MPVGESCEHVFLGPVPGRGSRAAISEAARAGVCHLNRSQPGWRKNRSFVSSPWGWLRGVPKARLGWGWGDLSPLGSRPSLARRASDCLDLCCFRLLLCSRKKSRIWGEWGALETPGHTQSEMCKSVKRGEGERMDTDAQKTCLNEGYHTPR